MNGNYLIDSNILIDLFKGDQSMIERVGQIKVVKIPVIHDTA